MWRINLVDDETVPEGFPALLSFETEQTDRVRIGDRLKSVHGLGVFHVVTAHQVKLLQRLALGVGVGEREEAHQTSEEAHGLEKYIIPEKSIPKTRLPAPGCSAG